eukprot:GEMP01001757.1.p1 GENE.GEMP01001757.1~~GEMP01001757.1.p1  ORF type:complete len:665 (+),score=134.69 GEMP01001757.1:1396-3390(+)
MARPTLCRLLFDCDIVDLHGGRDSHHKDKLRLSSVMGHFDSMAELHPSFPRPSVKTSDITGRLMYKITSSLSGAGREAFVKGLSRAERRVAEVHRKLKERAVREYKEELQMRENATEQRNVNSAAVPPPEGVSQADWEASKSFPALPPKDLVLEFKMQRLRDELLVRQQFCEPEIALWATQFGFLFNMLFDLYRDCNTKILGVASGHLSFSAFFRFCTDFELFPKIISFEELFALYSDLPLCTECAQPVEDMRYNILFRRNFCSSERGRSRRGAQMEPNLESSRLTRIGAIVNFASTASDLMALKSQRKDSKASSLASKVMKLQRKKSVGEIKVDEKPPKRISDGRNEDIRVGEANRLSFTLKPHSEMTSTEYYAYNVFSCLERWMSSRMGTVKDVFRQIGPDANEGISFQEFELMLDMMLPPIPLGTDKQKMEMFQLANVDGNGELSIYELDKILKEMKLRRECAERERTDIVVVKARRAETFLKLFNTGFLPVATPKGHRIFGSPAFVECLLIMTFSYLQNGNIAQSSSNIYHQALWLPTYLYSTFRGYSDQQASTRRGSQKNVVTVFTESSTLFFSPMQKALAFVNEWWSFLVNGDNDPGEVCGTCRRAATLRWGTASCPECSSHVSIDECILRPAIIPSDSSTEGNGDGDDYSGPEDDAL